MTLCRYTTLQAEKNMYNESIIMIITVMCIMLVFLCSCNSSKKIKYYFQKENYISVIRTVLSIEYNEDSTALYVDFS